MRLIAAAMLLALTGCGAQSNMTSGLEVGTGRVKVFPSATDPTLVSVNVLNGRDAGYDLDNADDRYPFVLKLLTAQCGAPSIVDERVTLLGDGTALRQWKTFTVTVRCPNGASSPVTR